MLVLLSSMLAMAAPLPQGVVIDLVDGTPQETAEMLARNAGISDLTLASPWSDDEALYVGTSSDDDASIAALQGLALVEHVEPLMIYQVTGFVSLASSCDNEPEPVPASVNDPSYAKQWHMRDMDSEWIWKNTSSGKDVVVAVLDTGLTLTKDVDPSRVVERVNFTDSRSPDDVHGHGTHCAGTIAQWTDNGYGTAGLAKEADLLSVKVLSDEGYGYNHWIAAGIDYATENGADVISMSLGGPSSSGTINAAIDRAVAAGVVVVAAAGNDGRGQLGWPAAHPPAIAIGSHGPDLKRAPYSNWGKGLDLMAPGGNKQIKDGGVFQVTNHQRREDVYEWQGTSMATPHAAAVAAILLGEGASAAEVEDIMKMTARDPVDLEHPEQYADGLIDPEEAVMYYRQQKNSSTPVVRTTNDRFDLPWPSPAGSKAYLVLGLSLGLLYLVQRAYKFSRSFILTAGAFALISGGPLYALTLLDFNLPGLAMFMVPWVEIPDYIFGPGASGFPVWMSPLPLCIPFLVGTPLGSRFRAITLGLIATWSSYLLLNSLLGFNPLWWVSTFGASAWLGISTLLLLSMGGVVTEFHYKHQGGE